MTPIFEKARLHWLADAEISFRTDGSSTGLSWFFLDPYERSAFCEAFGLPRAILALEDRMRSRFELVPRTWIKFHLHGSEVGGYSQYFVLDPRLGYPLTTLRVGLRALGAGDVSRIEPAFESVLGQSDSLWAIIAKWGPSGISQRLAGYVTRDSLPGLLADLVANDFLSDQIAGRFAALNGRMQADARAYLSLDLDGRDACTLDFHGVHLDSVPPPCVPYWGERSDDRRYLKARWLPGADEPQWTVYRSLPDVLTYRRPERTGSVAFREAAAYYDGQAAPIAATYGATYQAGGLEEGSFTEHLVATASIETGMRVVDAGCGACGPAVELAAAVPELSILGVTASARQAEFGKRHIESQEKEARVTVIVADYHRLPVRCGEADRVLFLESLGYADLETAVAEAARALRAGGRVYIKEPLGAAETITSAQTYALAEFDRVYAQRTPTVDAVRAALEKAGLRVTLCRPFGSAMTAERFTRSMFAGEELTEFGKTHYRAFPNFPVAFYELLAEKPSPTSRLSSSHS